MPVLRVMRADPTGQEGSEAMVRGAGSARRSSAEADSSSPDRWARSRCFCSLRLVFLFERSGTCAPSIPDLDGADVLLATVNPGLSRYTPERLQSFHSELLDRVQALPNVRSASLADAPLLRESHAYVDGVSVEGSDEAAETSSGSLRRASSKQWIYQFDSDGISHRRTALVRRGLPSSMRRSPADISSGTVLLAGM